MSFKRKFQRRVSRVLDGCYANWVPEINLDLGDVVRISSSSAVHEFSIKNRGISFSDTKSKIVTSGTEFKDGVAYNRSISGQGKSDALGAPVDAEVSLKFNGEGAFIYQYSDLTQVRFVDRPKVFSDLATVIFSNPGTWDDQFRLVTEVRTSSNASILVSDSGGASVDVKIIAKDPAGGSLWDAGIDIGSAFRHNSLMTYPNVQNCTLFFRPTKFFFSLDGKPPNAFSRILDYLKDRFGAFPNSERIILLSSKSDDNTAELKFLLPNENTIILYACDVTEEEFTDDDVADEPEEDDEYEENVSFSRKGLATT